MGTNVKCRVRCICFLLYLVLGCGTALWSAQAGNPFGNKQDFVWGDALNVMTYHRDKMNEYLCKNYIANEIVRGFKNVSKVDMKKRKGSPLKKGRLAREAMLADQGSKKYKDWLAR
ncbi:hypothetical protein RUM44_004861 [Polyplax serrata]|uniref:Uncharacterized protein n=1 Tax=Polyplax serrata TaxID=468196 RepID=A0ABR1B435_POLSC